MTRAPCTRVVKLPGAEGSLSRRPGPSAKSRAASSHGEGDPRKREMADAWANGKLSKSSIRMDGEPGRVPLLYGYKKKRSSTSRPENPTCSDTTLTAQLLLSDHAQPLPANPTFADSSARSTNLDRQLSMLNSSQPTNLYQQPGTLNSSRQRNLDRQLGTLNSNHRGRTCTTCVATRPGTQPPAIWV
jgi:hypothetical protein